MHPVVKVEDIEDNEIDDVLPPQIHVPGHDLPYQFSTCKYPYCKFVYLCVINN